MTIKDFSLLCGAKPQTLRYYDSVGLLKPARVDENSGYRHYSEEQAADFVRIKNLQRAGFTIEEIKNLIEKDDREICAAFDEKIAEAEARLAEIQSIRESYRTEMNDIKRKIERIKQQIEAEMRGYDPAEDFGITAEQYEGIIGSTLGAFDGIDLSQIKDIDYEPYHEGETRCNFGEEPPHDYSSDPDYELIYEKYGWKRAAEFMEELPPIEKVCDYALIFELDDKKLASGTAFMNTLLTLLLSKAAESKQPAAPGSELKLYCNSASAQNGVNSIKFFKKRSCEV